MTTTTREFRTAAELGPPPDGLCRCGCGQRSPIATRTYTERGRIKGLPHPYIRGHAPAAWGDRSPQWNGGRRMSGSGYPMILAPGHPRADGCGYVREHILIVEAAIGHPLPPGAEVHHVNGVRTDNRHENLVVCQDSTYHQLLHQRQRALAACGDANKLKCPYCKEYDERANIVVSAIPGRSKYHRHCHAAAQRRYNARRKQRDRAA